MFLIDLIMKNNKKHSEEFKLEMGFKSCDLNPSENSKEDLIFVRNMEKLEGNCNNLKDDTYRCTTYVDSNKNKIIKSECDKKE
ncbi:MAG: hypothetical protein EAX89_17370 [Candidatus Lokiarchaeota archaeon]|nr:hypothetical protein [Candidatus Lokiarchaeota archaeon]